MVTLRVGAGEVQRMEQSPWVSWRRGGGGNTKRLRQKESPKCCLTVVTRGFPVWSRARSGQEPLGCWPPEGPSEAGCRQCLLALCLCWTPAGPLDHTQLGGVLFPCGAHTFRPHLLLSASAKSAPHLSRPTSRPRLQPKPALAFWYVRVIFSLKILCLGTALFKSRASMHGVCVLYLEEARHGPCLSLVRSLEAEPEARIWGRFTTERFLGKSSRQGAEPDRKEVGE